MFSCEYSEIFKNTFLYRTPPVAASANFSVVIIIIVSPKSYNNKKLLSVISFVVSLLTTPSFDFDPVFIITYLLMQIFMYSYPRFSVHIYLSRNWFPSGLLNINLLFTSNINPLLYISVEWKVMKNLIFWGGSPYIKKPIHWFTLQICSGFYMTGTSVMRELKAQDPQMILNLTFSQEHE